MEGSSQTTFSPNELLLHQVHEQAAEIQKLKTQLLKQTQRTLSPELQSDSSMNGVFPAANGSGVGLSDADYEMGVLHAGTDGGRLVRKLSEDEALTSLPTATQPTFNLKQEVAPYNPPGLLPHASTSMLQHSIGSSVRATEMMNAQRDISTYGAINLNVHQMLPYPATATQGQQQEVAPIDQANGNPPPPAPSRFLVVIQDAPEQDYSESELYCHQLMRQRRGFPLYITQPPVNLPEEYKTRGVAIGDVGRVDSKGEFDFLFNIYLPADDRINANEVPEGFSPLSPPAERDISVEERNPGDYVCTPSVFINETTSEEFPGSTFRFGCFGPMGAVLALPHGGHSEKLANIANLRRYIKKNAASWYKYANVDRGRELPNGDLCLVTGWEKAGSYGMAAFQRAPEAEFPLWFSPVADAESGYKYRWHGGPVRHSKHLDRLSVETPLNHTTFIHAFSISLGERLWQQLFGTVQTCELAEWHSEQGSSGFVPYSSQASQFPWVFNFWGSSTSGHGARQNAGGGSGNHDNVHTSNLAPISQIIHPSKTINDYILRVKPQATVVMTHDDDWRDILHDDGKQSAVLDGSTLLEQMTESFEIIEEEGAAFFVLRPTTTPLANTASAYAAPEFIDPTLPELEFTIDAGVDDDADSQSFEEVDTKQAEGFLMVDRGSHGNVSPPQLSSPTSLSPKQWSHARSSSDTSSIQSFMHSPNPGYSSSPPTSPETDVFLVDRQHDPHDGLLSTGIQPSSDQKQTARRHSWNPVPDPPRSRHKNRSNSSGVEASVRDSLNAESLETSMGRSNSASVFPPKRLGSGDSE